MSHQKITFYLGTIVVMIVGLWGTVHVGQNLIAPTFIGGDWILTAAPSEPINARIEQSGKFAHISLDGGPNTRLYLQSEQLEADTGRVHMQFAGSEQRLEIKIPLKETPGVPTEILMAGPLTGQWFAERREKTLDTH